MKKILVTLAVTLSPVCAFSQALQHFTTDSGVEAKLLFSVKSTAAGFDYDSSGNAFFIGGAVTNAADTQIIEATRASGYSTLTPIVDYGSASNPVSTYGTFLTVKGSEIYWGDSVGEGNINAASTEIPTAVPAPTPIASMPDNYDLAFSGATALVSANIEGASSFAPENAVYTLNLSTGVYHDILNTGDYSGPIVVTSSGELIYGKSGYVNGGGIYIFSKASVQKAITSGTVLDLADASKVISNAGNGAFALGSGDELFSAFTPATGTATVTMYDLANGDATPIGSVSNEAYYFSGLSYFDGDLTVAETDGYNTSPVFTDFIEITAIPEPGAVPLVIAGVGLVIALRRKSPGAARR